MRLRPAVLLFIRNTSGADILDRGRGRGDLAGGGLLQAAMGVPGPETPTRLPPPSGVGYSHSLYNWAAQYHSCTDARDRCCPPKCALDLPSYTPGYDL